MGWNRVAKAEESLATLVKKQRDHELSQISSESTAQTSRIQNMKQNIVDTIADYTSSATGIARATRDTPGTISGAIRIKNVQVQVLNPTALAALSDSSIERFIDQSIAQAVGLSSAFVSSTLTTSKSKSESLGAVGLLSATIRIDVASPTIAVRVGKLFQAKLGAGIHSDFDNLAIDIGVTPGHDRDKIEIGAVGKLDKISEPVQAEDKSSRRITGLTGPTGTVKFDSTGLEAAEVAKAKKLLGPESERDADPEWYFDTRNHPAKSQTVHTIERDTMWMGPQQAARTVYDKVLTVLDESERDYRKAEWDRILAEDHLAVTRAELDLLHLRSLATKAVLSAFDNHVEDVSISDVPPHVLASVSALKQFSKAGPKSMKNAIGRLERLLFSGRKALVEAGDRAKKAETRLGALREQKKRADLLNAPIQPIHDVLTNPAQSVATASQQVHAILEEDPLMKQTLEAGTKLRSAYNFLTLQMETGGATGATGGSSTATSTNAVGGTAGEGTDAGAM